MAHLIWRFVAVYVSILGLTVHLLARPLFAEPISEEDKVKAVYLYHFSKLMEWEKDYLQEFSHFTLCTLSENPFSDYFETLSKESVHELPFKFEYLKDDNSSELKKCQVLYLPTETSDSKLQALRKELPRTLVVTNAPLNGPIRFLSIDGKIKFIINLPDLKQARINVSSRLLRVAYKIEKEDL